MKENSIQCTPITNKFAVECDAGKAGRFQVVTESLSILVGQQVRAEGPEHERMWGCLLVTCTEATDGSLDVQVMLFHPEWDEGHEIVRIKSQPNDSRQEPKC